MKIKYVIIFTVLLIAGNFLRLLVEDRNIPEIQINEAVSYKKDEARKENDLSASGEKFDVNAVEFDELLKLGFSKSKAEKLTEYREKVGIISNLEELRNAQRFGESGLKLARKYFFVDLEKIKDPVENYGRDFSRFNINEMDEDELKMLGFTKKEIRKILEEKGRIRSNIDLEEIIGEERFSEVEKRIKF